MSNLAGKYIVIEGVDCSGKSTQTEMLIDHLKQLGNDVEFVHQPGTTQLGIHLRKLIRGTEVEINAVEALETLFQAENQEMGWYLNKQRNIGKCIVSDRCNIVSCFSYGIPRGENMISLLRRTANDVEKFPALLPDHIIVLDIDIETYEDRQSRRGVEVDRIEGFGKDYLKKVIETYRIGYSKVWCPQSYNILDARRSIQDVHTDIIKIITG